MYLELTENKHGEVELTVSPPCALSKMNKTAIKNRSFVVHKNVFKTSKSSRSDEVQQDFLSFESLKYKKHYLRHHSSVLYATKRPDQRKRLFTFVFPSVRIVSSTFFDVMCFLFEEMHGK